MLSVWAVERGEYENRYVEACFATKQEADACALICGDGGVVELTVSTLVEWLQARDTATTVAEQEAEVSADELTRQEAAAQAAWLARDRSKDPEPVADVSNAHRDTPDCRCLGCQATGASWLRVTT